MFLIGDIGGTKCELALFGEELVPSWSTRYQSADFTCLEDVIEAFLQSVPVKPRQAGFGLAGVVENGAGRVTNLPWIISEDDLSEKFGFEKTILLNDLTAVCASLPVLPEHELMELYAGEKGGGVKGVIAPGTGLGEGYLIEQPFFYPRGSEGGHSNFAPADEEQIELLKWMRLLVNPVSYEDLIAGPGISYLYDFYVKYKGLKPAKQLEEQLLTAKDQTPVILNNAVGNSPCPVCNKVLNLFLSILGSEAGNLAMKLYARGGIYLGGGIMVRLAGRIDPAPLIKAYLNKGKMSGLMQKIPLYLITRKNAALVGAANYCKQYF
ncbi:MAG: glucokinase [Deltaproteobacteria bacterium]|nr:MAG: glucokinase [Deltaproteobacteria bacterium]